MRRRQHTPRYAVRLPLVTMRARAPRRARPRTRHASGGLGRILLMVVGVTVGLALLGGGAYALVRYLHRSPEYVVHHVEVEGASLLTADEVLERAGVEPGGTILSYDIHKARRNLLADPMICDATVTRRLPNTILVHVVERTPIARLDVGRTVFLVDRAGFLLTQAGPQETLPLIEGVYTKTAELKSGTRIDDEKLAAGLLVVALCRESPVLSEVGIKSVNVRNLRNVQLRPVPGPRVANGAVVELGENNFGQRLARLARALEHAQGRQLSKGDLSRDKLPSFEFR
jgi:cell division septal protein FtsQ